MTEHFKENIMNIIIRWVLYSLAIVFIAWLIPGITISNFVTALFVSILIGLINSFLKPILLFITLPINFLTLGLFTLIINAFLFWFAGYIAPGFEVSGFWSALFGSLILSALSVPISSIGDET